MACQSCHGWKRGLAIRSSSLVPRHSCFAYADRDSLIARSDRPRPRYVPDLEWFLAVQSKIINQKSSMAPRSRADGDQTSILAVPTLQSAASVTAVFSSYFTDRPAATMASCSGQSSQLTDTCGGDGVYPFVRCRHFAACPGIELRPLLIYRV